jgi:hypothetical protein
MSADWKSVDDEMPDSDTTVLIFSDESDEPVWLGYYDSENSTWRSVDACRIEVTHWAPLPQGPEK